MSRHGGDTNIQRGAQAGTGETGSAARTVVVVDPEIDRRILQRTRRVVAKVDAHQSLIQIALKNLKRWMDHTDEPPNAAAWSG